jgi:hypothetical protein
VEKGVTVQFVVEVEVEVEEPQVEEVEEVVMDFV